MADVLQVANIEQFLDPSFLPMRVGRSRIYLRGGQREGASNYHGLGVATKSVKGEDVSGVWGEALSALYCYHVTSARFLCFYINVRHSPCRYEI